MRLSHCESHCAGPFRYVPCLPKSQDASGGTASVAAASPAAGVIAAAEEQPPPVQKIEVAVTEEDDGEKPEDGVKTAVATAAAPRPTKSSLKKTSCGDSKCAAKGNVRWLDLLGKDLTEIKEFEPSECGESLDDRDGIAGSVCVIQ